MSFGVLVAEGAAQKTPSERCMPYVGTVQQFMRGNSSCVKPDGKKQLVDPIGQAMLVGQFEMSVPTLQRLAPVRFVLRAVP